MHESEPALDFPVRKNALRFVAIGLRQFEVRLRQ